MTDDILKDYEVVPDRARITTEYLFKVYEKFFGKEELREVNSDSAIAFIEILIRCWRDLFPDEYEGRLEQQKTDWVVERTVQEANKADGGYFVASFPPRLWAMFRVFMPNVKWTDRKNSEILTKNFPIMKGTKYSL